MIYAETKVVAYVIIEKMGIYCGIYDVESVPDSKYDPTQFSVTSIIVAHRYKVVCRITVSQFLYVISYVGIDFSLIVVGFFINLIFIVI